MKRIPAFPFCVVLIAISLLLSLVDNLYRQSQIDALFLSPSRFLSQTLAHSLAHSLSLTSPFPTDIAFRHSYTLSFSHAFMRAFSCHSHFPSPPHPRVISYSLSLFSECPSHEDSHFSIVLKCILTRSYCRQLPTSTGRRVSRRQLRG